MEKPEATLTLIGGPTVLIELGGSADRSDVRSAGRLSGPGPSPETRWARALAGRDRRSGCGLAEP